MAQSRQLAVFGYAALALVLAGLVLGGVKLLESLADAWRDVEAFDSAKLPWEECRLPLPDDSVAVFYLQRPAHGIAALVERQVRLERHGEPPITRWIPPSMSGKTDVNVYWYASAGASGPLLKLEHRWGACLLDLPRRTVSAIGRRAGVTHLVEIPDSDDGPVEPLWVRGEAPGEWRFSAGATVGRHLVAWPPESGGTYLGRIDCKALPLRFVPAEEAAVEPIEPEDWKEVP